MSKEKKQKFEFSSAPTQKWSDLDELHLTLVNGLGDMSLEIQKHLLILLSDEKFRVDPEVKLFQQCFLEDLKDFAERLNNIKAKYEGKSGLVKEDEIGIYFTLGGEYEIVSGLITDVLFKTSTEIQNKVMHLIAIREAELKKEQEQSENKETINE